MFAFVLSIEDDVVRSKLETIYELYSKAMYNCAYSILRNVGDAEDSIQEAFFRLLRNINSIDDASSHMTKSYAIIITESCAIDIYRKRKRLKEVELQEDFIFNYDDVEYHGDNQVTEEIFKLNLRQRNVLILRYVYGFDYDSIASSMKISTANARKLVQRAKDSLEENCRERGLL